MTTETPSSETPSAETQSPETPSPETTSLLESGDPQLLPLLREARGLLARNDFASAERLLNTVLSLHKDDCAALLLLGQMRGIQNRLEEAESLYRRAMEVEPRRAEIRYLLGQTLVRANRVDEAIEQFREAIRLKPNFALAFHELGLALSRKEDLSGAEKAYRDALRLQPNLLATKQALSATLIILGRPREAESVARAALIQAQRDPNWFVALEHNLAVALSEQHRFDEAIAIFDDIRQTAPGLPKLDYNRGNALLSAGRVRDAEMAFRIAIARDPLDMKAHSALNSLLYKAGNQDFLRSYDELAAAYPDQAPVVGERASLLFALERYEEARDAFTRTLALAPDNAGARHGLALSRARLGDFDAAITEFERLVADQPEDLPIRCSFAECLSRAGVPDKAVSHLEGVIDRDPYNQSALALLGTVLRQIGDSREATLNDYDAFVDVVDLEPPPGYADMAAFNAELGAYLSGLQPDMREQANRTLRQGTRTSGILFGAGRPLLDALQNRADEALSNFVARMAPDIAHPFLGRRSEKFRYAGSWATRLADGGFHISHVHPRSWISAVYYVAVPDISRDENEKQGWLAFGEPPFDAGLQAPVRRMVQPKPGRLVLHPSYLWHATTPFRSSEARTAIGFDIVPEKEAVH